MGHYRDKGYGMGFRTGYISGLRGDRSELKSVGVTFDEEYGRPMFYIALILGVLILFSTQLGIVEGMVRVTTDAAHGTSPRLRKLSEGDPRRFYYPFLLMYLNSKLPKPARPRPWHYVILVLNVVFFGFFFINFVADLVGDPLITF